MITQDQEFKKSTLQRNINIRQRLIMYKYISRYTPLIPRTEIRKNTEYRHRKKILKKINKNVGQTRVDRDSVDRRRHCRSGCGPVRGGIVSYITVLLIPHYRRLSRVEVVNMIHSYTYSKYMIELIDS